MAAGCTSYGSAYALGLGGVYVVIMMGPLPLAVDVPPPPVNPIPPFTIYIQISGFAFQYLSEVVQHRTHTLRQQLAQYWYDGLGTRTGCVRLM